MEETDKTHWRKCAFALLVLLASVLTGCSSISGNYGPGAGHFHTVIVDAGHGGHDRGARAAGGSPEKMVALDTARRLATELRKSGFRVIETRSDDRFIPLGGRTDISNRTGSAIFVSIHYNWAPRYAANGIEIYYYTPRSRRLAANILDEVMKAYPTSNRGIKQRGFYVLRNNRKPAVLCELGFVSSSNDNKYVQNPRYRQRLAERVAAGIIAESRGESPR